MKQLEKNIAQQFGVKDVLLPEHREAGLAITSSVVNIGHYDDQFVTYINLIKGGTQVIKGELVASWPENDLSLDEIRTEADHYIQS